MLRLNKSVRLVQKTRKNRVACSGAIASFSSTKVSNADPSNPNESNIVSSPFPPIGTPSHSAFTEFVTEDWDQKRLKQVAILDGTTGQYRTFHEYKSDMTSIAASLKHDMDVDAKTIVALFSPNHVDYVPICLATAMTGGKLTPINPMYTEMELSTILNHSGTKVLIAHASVMDVALKALKSCPEVKHVVTIPDANEEIVGGSVPEGTTNLCELKLHSTPMQETVGEVNLDTPYLIPYSSGTTGLPKGVCLSHGNLISNLLQLDIAEGSGLLPEHKLISPLPFFHIYGFLVSAVYCAWRGQEILTTSGRFDLENFCSLVEEHKPDRAHLVPPIVIGLAKHPVVENFDLKSIKMILSAAAPMGSSTEQELKDRLGCQVKQAWGMSELSPVGTLSPDDNVKSGSVGPLVSSTFAKILCLDTGKNLGPGESGELLIKGPQVMIGYLGDPDKTSECLCDDGWLRTGDIAYYDEDGYFYITDRLKELIKVRGYQVAPAELEALLLTNEKIKDAAVIPVKDEASGELPRAYIVPKDDGKVGKDAEKEIQDWVKERVAPFKKLAGGVVFVDAIPKSASGKLLRRVLRDQAETSG
eukprot:CAMPEP_0195522998 /NCGR_PEP_ID=MMETSP0794_2-20130614/21709_1 /TAXON_ID=515487 /ORGANISM="Stephanopyxis turris, Strain CCMP 815" /LENGTH=586 /DNA_ID=CAMNT_0040652891 /DNA_START=102 /DNA_END=1862 /DNA_ORIENTATION=+